MPSDDLPRFAVVREFLHQYGDEWTVWGGGVSYIALLVLLTIAAADASDASVWTLAIHSAAVFFLAGFWWVLWSNLFEDAQDRHADTSSLSDADTVPQRNIGELVYDLTCPGCGEAFEIRVGVGETVTGPIECPECRDESWGWEAGDAE